MKKTLALALMLALGLMAAPLPAQDDQAFEPFSPDQLDNLLAPIALYPDPLLAQVLLAATFPDQIDAANRFVREDSNPDDIDAQPWDVSVRAVAHYPEVLSMMADKLDWTTALGQAYVNQSTDVMASVQRLRAQARSVGTLVTTPQMEVIDAGGEIEIWPAEPQYIYVPEYDPAIAFFVHVPLFYRARFFIGAWLIYDFDWREHRIFYHGWDEHGRGWAVRSRPYVRMNSPYINIRFRDAFFNRNVIQRPVNYRGLDRYDDIRRKSNFDNFRGNRRVVTPPPPPARETIRNKIIDRNFNPNDPRINENRGHAREQPPAAHTPETPAFTPPHSDIDARQASQRGRASRSEIKPPPAPPKPPAEKPPAKKERKRP